MFIKEITPNIIKNSRKENTVEIILTTYEGKFKASAPSGKSTGKTEVPCYHEKGISHSMKLLKIFCKKLEGKNFLIKKLDDIKQLNDLMKKFEEKYGYLGGNVWYAIEAAFLKAASADTGKQLWQFVNDSVNSGKKPKSPMPVGNCIGGGLHSKKIKGKRPDFQEFLLIPDEKTYHRAATINLRAYEYAKKLLKATSRNDENAWQTPLTNEEVLEILRKVADKYKLRIGLDIASSSFYENGYYKYKNKNLIRDRLDQVDYITRLIKKFKIFYAEDPIDEDDFSGFKQILGSITKTKTLITGDDLTTTNPKRVSRAIQSKSMNAMIVKPNQIGSILEVKKVVELCKKNNIQMIFSHRSGETMDNTLADYCIGFGGQFMKSGIYGKERLIKIKRMIDIEKSLK